MKKCETWDIFYLSPEDHPRFLCFMSVQKRENSAIYLLTYMCAYIHTKHVQPKKSYDTA